MKAYGQPTISAINKPVIYIMPQALEKMELYVKHCNDEIGWLGFCTKQENNYFITDVELFEQEVNGATCEIDEQCVAEFAESLLSKPNGIELCNSIRVWGHSHVNMGVTPSGQDEVQFKRLYSDSGDYYIRIIANKKGEMKVDFHDCITGVTFNNVAWIEYRVSSVDSTSIIAEIKEKVTKKVYTAPKIGYTTKGTSIHPYYASQQASIYGEDGYEKSYWWQDNSKKKADEVEEIDREVDREEEDEFDDIFMLKRPVDLITMLGLEHEDIEILDALDNVSAMDLLNESQTNYMYMLNLVETDHIMDLVRDYVLVFKD